MAVRRLSWLEKFSCCFPSGYNFGANTQLLSVWALWSKSLWRLLELHSDTHLHTGRTVGYPEVPYTLLGISYPVASVWSVFLSWSGLLQQDADFLLSGTGPLTGSFQPAQLPEETCRAMQLYQFTFLRYITSKSCFPGSNAINKSYLNQKKNISTSPSNAAQPYRNTRVT